MSKASLPQNRRFARQMRREPTEAEHALWQVLRGSKLEAMKFRRQVPLGAYIVDFVCFSEKLIIEVDGGQHSENKRDAVRDAYFHAQGYRVLRFWNDEVLTNLDGVCGHILSMRKSE